MNWLALITVMMDFFGPIVRKLIEDWLRKAVPELDAPNSPRPAADAVTELFVAARSRTYVWQFAKRRLLAACERVAVGRAAEFVAACATGKPVVMTRDEEKVIALAV